MQAPRGGRTRRATPRVDPAQPAQHAPAGGRPGVPVAGARPRGRRLGAGAAHGLRRHRLPRRLPRPQARPDLGRSARSSTRWPTGSTSSPSSSGSRCATSSRGGWPICCRCATPLMWGLVPLLRTRGYSALPVHFLGKAATFNLLYAFPLLLLGDGDGHRRDAGRGVRLGVRVLGDRPLLVGRRPLRLAGAPAAGHHRRGAARWPAMPEAPAARRTRVTHCPC